jgi:protein TonB
MGADRGAAHRKLIALTRDATLAKALQELADETSIHVVADLRQFTDELLQHAGSIALLDAAALDAPLEAAVDAITTQFPELRLMVAGQAPEQNLLATRIASETVFRFVHKPASPQRVKLFLEAAARSGERRRVAAASAPSIDLATGSSVPPGGAGSRGLLIAAAAVVVLAAGAAWVFWPKAEEKVVAPAATVPTPDPALLAQVDDLLARAAAAFAAGQFVASNGSSAAELYRDALKLDADNRKAREGFTASIDNAIGAAEKALLAGRLGEAGLTAETVRLINPDNSRLAFLNTQIEREMARVNADTAQREALEARQAEVRDAVAAMNERLRAGALIEPVTDNAVSRFREAEAIGAGDPPVRSARDRLVAALLTAADNELNAHRTNSARRLMETAGQVNSSAPGLDVVRRRIEEVVAQAVAPRPTERGNAGETGTAPQVAATVPANTPQPAAIEPAAAPATTASTSTPAFVPGEGIVSSSLLTVLRRTAPVYPAEALERLVSGSVELEFTVAKDGSVKDIDVVSSEPRRVFDTAAVTALRKYRYSPVLRDGQPVEQRARTRMRFTAQSN